ncbi:hypothetical protein MIMGU_mgv1a004791mg [Erythranthe guttata]|uniref:DCD domain-containing protein n=1 Tax=Erythranthe guttata TaxID=4155 RepID=A0A022S2R8_ERYGU|nr:hypothetical protein MIMGU_mgv1a004791mg [Erythranthe guttata]
MAPRKNRKKTEQVVSGKKLLKNGKKAAESTLEEEVSDRKTAEGKKASDVKESVSPSMVKKKPCTWLKLDRLVPQTEKKSSVESIKQGKEAKISIEVQRTKDNKRKRTEKSEEEGNNHPKYHEKYIDSHHAKKEKRDKKEERGNNDTKFYEKHIDSRREKRENEVSVNDRDDEAEKMLGGLIFMCNAKTKPDCFSYQVMGVPAHKKEVVMDIKPGLKIFLYDYDMKLMYGVYEASSAGGMKLEPAAFGGGFPAQVNRLIDLFSPGPCIHPNSRSMVHEINPAHTNNFGIADIGGGKTIHQNPLFLTEKDYRTNGLRQERPLFAGDGVGQTWERNNLDQELKHLLNHPSSTSVAPPVQQREVSQLDPFTRGEREYQLYGLRGPQQTLTATNVVRDSVKGYCDPYDESTTALVNRYLAMPRMAGVPEESYNLARRGSYINDLNSRTVLDGDRAVGSRTLREQSTFNQRPYSLDASREPSVLHQGFHIQREIELTSAPVSSRYSFAGPSPSQHR